MEVGFERHLKQDGMRKCWNWQTGMTKDHVSTDVRVQVPFSALRKDLVRNHKVFYVTAMRKD